MNNSYENDNNKITKSYAKVGIIMAIFIIVIIISAMAITFTSLKSDISTFNGKENEYDQKTKAIITNIYVDEKGNDFDVDFEYLVDGVKYFGKLNYYSNKMYEGQEIEILYKSENPSKYYSNPFSSNIKVNSISFIFPFVFSVIVAVLILVVFVFAFKKQNKKEHINKNEKLKISGIRLIGTIKDIEIVASENGGEPTRRIICTYTNLQGNVVTVKSEPVYDSIEIFFRERGVRTVDVYVDQNKSNNYFVDVESIKR